MNAPQYFVVLTVRCLSCFLIVQHGLFPVDKPMYIKQALLRFICITLLCFRHCFSVVLVSRGKYLQGFELDFPELPQTKKGITNLKYVKNINTVNI